MATQVAAVDGMVAIGLDHHGHGVPAHVGPQPLFDLQVARATLFLIGFDGVHITGVGRERHVDAALAGVLQHSVSAAPLDLESAAGSWVDFTLSPTAADLLVEPGEVLLLHATFSDGSRDDLDVRPMFEVYVK